MCARIAKLIRFRFSLKLKMADNNKVEKPPKLGKYLKRRQQSEITMC